MGTKEDRERAEAAIERHLRDQEGVISRRQVITAGAGDAVVERRLRRREWARVHEGVYVDHTGTLTWDQRAWAGVLLHPVAALDGASALRVAGVRTTGPVTDTVELVVPGNRRVQVE